MNNSLKNALKKVPFLTEAFRLLRYLKHKVSFAKRIKGKNNIIEIDSSAYLPKCKFDIIGNDNKISISKSTFFNSVTFYIRGNNNTIVISEKVKFYVGDHCGLKIMIAK